MSKPPKSSPTHVARQSTDTPAYLSWLELENIRCFGSEPQAIDFCGPSEEVCQWTVLIGNNGTGKTTVLECLASFDRAKSNNPNCKDYIPRFLKWPGETEDLHLLKVGAERWMLKLAIDSGTPLLEMGSETDVEVYASVGFADGSVSFNADDMESVQIPTFYAYGAGRRMGEVGLSEHGLGESRLRLINDSTEMRNAAEWLLQLDYSASKSSDISQQQRERFEQVRNLLIDILPDVSDIRISTPTKARPQPVAEFQTPDGWMPLHWMSYGYRTLIAWMVDFASRMVERYPRHKNPLDQPAVVLVDEIDLHLHPRWQRTLMTFLSEKFPNTQFIVTAHSPVFVQAAHDANIVVLRRDEEKGHVVIDNDPEAVRGWRIDQLLTSDLFGLESSRSPRLEPLLKERTQLLSKRNLSKADKARLDTLAREIGELPTGDTSEEAQQRDLLQRTLDALEKQLEM